MMIEEIDGKELYFDDGSQLGSRYYPEGMEKNYADYEQIEDLAWACDFDENLIFKKVRPFGFRFGNEDQMFFIPCYSIQNGHYPNKVDVVYNGNIVLKAVNCEIVSH